MIPTSSGLALYSGLDAIISRMEQRILLYRRANPSANTTDQQSIIDDLKFILSNIDQAHRCSEFWYEQYQDLLSFTNALVDVISEDERKRIKPNNLAVIYPNPSRYDNSSSNTR